MLIHPWDAPTDDAEWQDWLAGHDFGQLAVNGPAGAPPSSSPCTSPTPRPAAKPSPTSPAPTRYGGLWRPPRPYC